MDGDIIYAQNPHDDPLYSTTTYFRAMSIEGERAGYQEQTGIVSLREVCRNYACLRHPGDTTRMASADIRVVT